MHILFIVFTSLLSQFVNPFVGTDAHGHTFPGAVYPFGMLQVSPDTRPFPGDRDGCSGYHYSDTLIYGFSHTHLSGTGRADLCDVLLMPVVNYTADSLDRRLYCSPFSHSDETASPGYYEVFLEKPAVRARSTVGLRSGMHEFTFPASSMPQLLIDLTHRDDLISVGFNYDENAAYGYRKSTGLAKEQDVFFYMTFSEPVLRAKAGPAGGVLTFRKSTPNVITVRVGISSVSVANAVENLYSDYDVFSGMKERAASEWENYLSTVDCPFSDTERKRIFYTALYHTAIHPSLFSDVSGEYRGMDREMHAAEGWARYNVFSLRDTFRGLHPLLCRISPDLAVDFMKSFLSIYGEGGKLPVWELQGNETDCVIGYHSAPVIADAIARGITDFDVAAVFEALLASSRREECGLGSFRRNGLVLADDERESVSRTLEYAYDDWCVAQIAKYLGRTREYDEYMTSAQYWRNVFDPSTGFMRARSNGRWLPDFDPLEANGHYTGGNAWQYSFFVPHDIVGLMNAMGGRASFCARLDSLFCASPLTAGNTPSDMTGRIGQYAHGNVSGHHIPYLYALAGKPEKTRAVVDSIMNSLYSSAPDGICGNDGCGQLSAWYVLSAIGEYPVCPGIPENRLTFVPKTITVNPVFEMESDVVCGPMTVSIGNVEPGSTAWYRCGKGDFQRYTGPFTITGACMLEAYSVSPSGRRSFVTRSVLQGENAEEIPVK